MYNQNQYDLFSQPPMPDFTKVLHTRENNPVSEAHLKKNKYHFTGQCAVILSLLRKGIRLTSRSAMLEYNISHLARRIKDLKDKGGMKDIIKDFEIDNRGTKEWFIELT